MRQGTLLLLIFLTSIGCLLAVLKGGIPAPDFTLPDIKTGEPVTLSSFRGEVVILRIWKVCRGKCRTNVPVLNRIANDFLKENFPHLNSSKLKSCGFLQVLSVNALNPPQKVLAEMQKLGVNYQVLAGRKSGITRAYRTVTLPQIYVIDKDGIIRSITAYPDYDELSEVIKPLIEDIISKGGSSPLNGLKNLQ